MVRRNTYDAPPLISVSTTSNAQGSIVLGGALGTAALSIFGSAMQSLPLGLSLSVAFVWQLVLIAPAGERIALVGGPMIVSATPTYP
jgi:hypothetical protein